MSLVTDCPKDEDPARPRNIGMVNLPFMTYINNKSRKVILGVLVTFQSLYVVAYSTIFVLLYFLVYFTPGSLFPADQYYDTSTV